MTKRIVIMTIGSRGDVQPYVALGRGLIAAGYRVRVLTHRTFEGLVTENDLDFGPLAGEPREFLEQLASDKTGASLLTFMRQLDDWLSGFMSQALADVWAGCQDADLVISTFLSPVGHSIAEKLNIPAMFAHLFPTSVVTRERPGIILPDLPLGGLYNRLANQLERAGAGYSQRQNINQWRQQTLGLAPYSPFNLYPYDELNGQPVHDIHGYSPHVVPRPADYPDHVHVTGYWFLDTGTAWEPPPALQAFLAAGPPPVYVGFGSLIDRNAKQLIDTVKTAVRQAGQRLLLLSGWAGLASDTLSDDVFIIKSAPHDWLFPRMRAVIHHGGAGTTAASVRAGVPTIVVPFFGDQPFWGRVVAARGIGPHPIPAHELTVDGLAAAIREATTDETMRQRAQDVGAAIQAEDGVGNAVRVIQDVLQP